MTIGSLWLPSLGGGASLPLQPYLKAYGAVTYTSGSDTFTFSNAFSGNLASYTTASGDCVVVSYSFPTNNAFVASATGCGATWVVNDQFGIGSSFDQGILVGYNCTAGGSSVVLSGGQISVAATGIIAVFGSLTTSNPITASVHAGTTGASTITSGSLSYTANSQVLVAAAGGSTNAAWSSASWSNGISNVHIASDSTQRMVTLDAVIASSGSSTTVTETCASGGIGVYAVALTHL